MKNPPRYVVLTFTILGLCLVAGCSGGQLGDGLKKGKVESKLSVEDARQEALVFEGEFARQFPGAKWEVNTDGALPDRCETKNGDEGAYFIRALRRGDSVKDSAAEAQIAVEYVRNLGFSEIDEKSFAKGNHQFLATGPTGIEVYYVAEDDHVGVTFESACVAGDYTQIRAEYGRTLLDRKSPTPSASLP